MPKIDILDMKGNVVDSAELSDRVFGIEPNEPVVHQVVVAQLANKRQGTKGSKTRSEVRGGGRKPWRQKGTGRARAGSSQVIGLNLSFFNLLRVYQAIACRTV